MLKPKTNTTFMEDIIFLLSAFIFYPIGYFFGFLYRCFYIGIIKGFEKQSEILLKVATEIRKVNKNK